MEEEVNHQGRPDFCAQDQWNHVHVGIDTFDVEWPLLVFIGSVRKFALSPDIEFGLAVVLLVSSVANAATSIPMAMHHRKGDIPIRNVFIGTGIASVFLHLLMVWFHQDATDLLNFPGLQQTCFSLF